MRYPLTSDHSLSPAAIQAAVESLQSGRYTMGPHVEAFEKAFAAWVGAEHAVMVNSGSSANLLAVEAMMRPSSDLPSWYAGDEILVPALSWPTTVWPLLQLGLVPVFVDIDPDTLAMDLNAAKRALTARTRGVMLIHVLGLAADMTAWRAFCQNHDLWLIEDCCEAFGAYWNDFSVGNFGTMGTFSHYFSHQLTTIEGGTVITDDAAIADDLRSMRSHGWTRNRCDRAEIETNSTIDTRFLFVTTGYNVRPMEVQGAMGVEQLKVAEEGLKQRDQTARETIAVLSEIPWLEVIGAPYVAADGCARHQRQHSWMNLPIRLRPGAPRTRDDVVQVFQGYGIETRPILAGNLLRHPVMRTVHVQQAACPVADAVMRDGFMIGCHPMTQAASNALFAACQALRLAA